MEISHCGFVTVVGRPSSGKSTFLNTLCGYKVSIVSPIPQTTRNRVRAIYNEKDLQAIFIDTPGMHFNEREYNQGLVRTARSAFGDSDVIILMVDLSREIGREDKMIMEMLQNFSSKLIIAYNKKDLVSQETVDERVSKINDILKSRDTMIISALNKESVISLARLTGSFLPPGPRLYDEDYYTDQGQEFRISEIIREKIFNLTREEIPHSSYVKIEEIMYMENPEKISIKAAIYVENNSQKIIMIGKKGSLIRKIGVMSRKDISRIFGKETDLFLKVKVHSGWRKDAHFLKDFFGK